MKYIKWFWILAIFLIVSSSLFFQIFREREVPIQSTALLPDFKITVNGASFSAKFNQENAMFPLFLYHGMIYYPITGASKKLLNLQEDETGSENKIVLYQANMPIIKDYIPETIAPPHPEYFQRNMSSVTVSNKTLKVNDIMIAAPDMEYPLLEYALVTYMPLTPEFITKQLHGSCYLDSMGLEIKTVTDDLLYHAE